MKTAIIAAILAILPAFGLADELAVSINLSSYHFDRSQNFNERNHGLGIRYGDWSVGYYNNSIGRNSAYALKSYLNGDKLKYGYFVGLVTGYPLADVLPAAGLQAVVEFKQVSLNVFATPTISGVNYGFIGFQLLISQGSGA